jgi:hypothetical protein
MSYQTAEAVNSGEVERAAERPNHIPHRRGYEFRYGFEVIVDGGPLSGVLATFSDDATPDLTPGGQHRSAMRVARKALAQGHDAYVRGYHGGLGSYIMIDDPTDDYAPCPADFMSNFPEWNDSEASEVQS